MFHKVYTLTCNGGERGGCPFHIETARRDLPMALSRMKAHANDTKHHFDNRKATRAFRVAAGTPA